MESFNFPRIKKLPPYIFSVTDELKNQALEEGRDIIDMSMGNPDQPTPKPIVNKLIEASSDSSNHRYSSSKGISELRSSIADWYLKRYGVVLNADSETVVTMGSKEGLAHLVLGIIDKGDVVLCPDPAYPIHAYSVTVAGGDLKRFPLHPGDDFFENMKTAYFDSPVRPKLLMLNFPHNPTTEVVNLEFFERLVEFALQYKMLVIHDLAYADICFDGYKAPSLLQVPGAMEIGVETFSLSKSYNMPGWRVGFCAGNQELIAGLIRIKSYLDYGMFQPIQIAAIEALRGAQHYVNDISDRYASRRDTLVTGLRKIGWPVARPRATMFVWAKIPEAYQKMGSLEFAKLLLKEADVAVSPGIGFGEEGDRYVRFALIENEERIKQGVRGIRKLMLEQPV